MALSASTMAATIVTNLQSLNPNLTGQAVSDLTSSWTQICSAIILHIQTDALVSSTGTAAVTAAPGSAPVTALGTIS